MGKFLQSEKLHQAKFKATSPYISQQARELGIYRSHDYPFCLPCSHAEENLFENIRTPALEYFAINGIKWHDGQNGKPSNHLCDSMVCCVNFLFPFHDKPEALADLLRPAFPSLYKMLPIENGQYIAMEWIGQKNYLGEKITRNRQRTRGANFTSADAAVSFENQDGKIQIALIEWKYTESYFSTPLHTAKSGTKRTEIYSSLFHSEDCPIDKNLLPSYEDLFYEPFYQFMRQQLLAWEMEKAHELGADLVVLLHISPASNIDFQRVTSPRLCNIADTATTVWGKLVRIPGRFISINSEQLFSRLNIANYPELETWWDYITSRYRWVK